MASVWREVEASVLSATLQSPTALPEGEEDSVDGNQSASSPRSVVLSSEQGPADSEQLFSSSTPKKRVLKFKMPLLQSAATAPPGRGHPPKLRPLAASPGEMAPANARQPSKQPPSAVFSDTKKHGNGKPHSSSTGTPSIDKTKPLANRSGAKDIDKAVDTSVPSLQL